MANDEIRAEAVRALGFNKASRTQLEKVIALIDEPPTDPVEPPVEPEPDPLPGTTEPPTFTVVEGGVKASWPAAANATHYRVTRQGDEEGFDVDQTHAILPLSGGEWVCVEPRTATDAAEASCATYEAVAEPEPEPPSGDWTLVHEFSPAAGEPIPDGVTIKLKDGSWVPGGKAERTEDGYLMTYLEGSEDGRGPGRLGIEKEAIPQGHRNLMCEYDITISSDFEDHPVYNKIAHYRTQQPAREFDTIRHGAKFIDKFRNNLIGYACDSGTSAVEEKFTPDGDLQIIYPDDWAGYNSVVGNHRRDRLVGDQQHTVRVEWTWVRQDETYSEGNWYRVRWWLDGVLQGDFPEIPMWGGPSFIYWEIAPTWGGNGGHVKQKEDYMLISRVATWVR